MTCLSSTRCASALALLELRLTAGCNIMTGLASVNAAAGGGASACRTP